MRNKRGEGYIMTCVLIIIICMLLSVFVTFFTAVNIVKTVERNSRVVLDSFVMENSIEIYDSIKNGNDETSTLDNSKYVEALSEFCTFVKNGTRYYNYDQEGNGQYSISEPQMSFAVDTKLKVKIEYSVYIPIYFAGVQVSTAEVPLKVESDFNEKF